MDPSAEEESCSVISLIVGITGNPAYYSDKKGLDNVKCRCSTIGMNGPGSVAPETLREAINQGM